MTKQELEKFLSKHSKFRVLKLDEILENDISVPCHVSTEDGLESHFNKRVMPSHDDVPVWAYLAYSDDYLQELKDVRNTIANGDRNPESSTQKDWERIKVFMNKYVYR